MKELPYGKIIDFKELAKQDFTQERNEWLANATDQKLREEVGDWQCKYCLAELKRRGLEL